MARCSRRMAGERLLFPMNMCAWGTSAIKVTIHNYWSHSKGIIQKCNVLVVWKIKNNNRVNKNVTVGGLVRLFSLFCPSLVFLGVALSFWSVYVLYLSLRWTHLFVIWVADWYGINVNEEEKGDGQILLASQQTSVSLFVFSFLRCCLFCIISFLGWYVR